jgi:hypothetical protein
VPFCREVVGLTDSLRARRWEEALVHMHKATALHEAIEASYRNAESVGKSRSRAALALRHKDRNKWMREKWTSLAREYPQSLERARAILRRWPQDKSWKEPAPKTITGIARDQGW